MATAFTTGTHTFHSITFTEVDPAEVQELNLIFQREGDSERSVHISRNDFRRIGFADPAPSWAIYSIADSVIIPAYVSMGNNWRRLTLEITSSVRDIHVRNCIRVLAVGRFTSSS